MVYATNVAVYCDTNIEQNIKVRSFEVFLKLKAMLYYHHEVAYAQQHCDFLRILENSTRILFGSILKIYSSLYTRHATRFLTVQIYVYL